jgi:hypothetical protein
MLRRAACLTAAALLAAGCLSASPAGTSVVTVTRTRTPTAPPSAPQSSGTASATAATSSAAPPLTGLPGTCATLLSTYSVDNAVGTTVAGGTAFVVGTPQADIGRLAYLNCRYGITGRGAAALPKIEVGVSLYRTPEQAAARVTATRSDYGAHGATGVDVPVGAATGRWITGGKGAGYTDPILVVAAGQRTVAVTIAPALATGAAAQRDAVQLARLTLQRTGG